MLQESSKGKLHILLTLTEKKKQMPLVIGWNSSVLSQEIVSFQQTCNVDAVKKLNIINRGNGGLEWH